MGLRSPGMNQRQYSNFLCLHPFTGNIATSVLYIPAQIIQLMIRKCLFCATSAYKRTATVHCIAVYENDFFFFFFFFFFFN